MFQRQKIIKYKGLSLSLLNEKAILHSPLDCLSWAANLNHLRRFGQWYCFKHPQAIQICSPQWAIIVLDDPFSVLSLAGSGAVINANDQTIESGR